MRLVHYNGHLVGRRGRIRGVSPRKKPPIKALNMTDHRARLLRAALGFADIGQRLVQSNPPQRS